MIAICPQRGVESIRVVFVVLAGLGLLIVGGCIDDPESFQGTDAGVGDVESEVDPGQFCAAGAEFCTDATASGGACVDLESDPDHCGDCNRACEEAPQNARATCESGTCGVACLPDYQWCADRCVDLESDLDHCGECGEACADDIAHGAPICDDGECSFVCVEGALECVPGECALVESSDEHCGQCGASCDSGYFCETGSCVELPCYEGNAPFGGGVGSVDDPYTICSIDHLRNIDDPQYLDQHFVLYDDLDLAGEDMEPIGRGYWEQNADDQWVLHDAFDGRFDGNGHILQNLSIDRADESVVGLFGDGGYNAELVDIHLVDVDIQGETYVGGLVGPNYGLITGCQISGQISGHEQVGAVAGRNLGTIEGCEVVDDTEVSGQYRIGGLVGKQRIGLIDDSQSAARVFAGDSRAGGLVGELMDGEVLNAEATGDVEVTTQRAGGLVGEQTGASLIESSWAHGEITGGSDAAGLVGRVSDVDASIVDSHATGNISGHNWSGGLVGPHHGSIQDSSATGDVEGHDHVGGLVGRTSTTTGEIVNSSAQGTVTGHQEVGGLVGANNGEIRSSHATGDVVGQDEVGGLVGLNHGEIMESMAAGDIDGSGYVGGLVGFSQGLIERSFATGDVGASEAHRVGGLVGVFTEGAVVRDCYATGEVDGNEEVGGLVGTVGEWGDGGFLYTSHSTGAVPDASDEERIGGLVGWNRNIVEESYWNTTTSGALESDGGQGVEDAEYGETSSFPGFDFEAVWEISSDAPRLVWESE